MPAPLCSRRNSCNVEHHPIQASLLAYHAQWDRDGPHAHCQWYLVRLLGAGLLLSTNVLADVGSISGLPDDVLEGAPALASGRRSALVGELSIDTGSELGDGTLHEGALRIAGTEKDGVHDK